MNYDEVCKLIAVTADRSRDSAGEWVDALENFLDHIRQHMNKLDEHEIAQLIEVGSLIYRRAMDLSTRSTIQ